MLLLRVVVVDAVFCLCCGWFVSFVYVLSSSSSLLLSTTSRCSCCRLCGCCCCGRCCLCCCCCCPLCCVVVRGSGVGCGDLVVSLDVVVATIYCFVAVACRLLLSRRLMICPLGTIPHTIGKLTTLTDLYLSSNQLSGDDVVVVVVVVLLIAIAVDVVVVVVVVVVLEVVVRAAADLCGSFTLLLCLCCGCL